MEEKNTDVRPEWITEESTEELTDGKGGDEDE